MNANALPRRWVPLSLPRRMIVEIMHLCRHVPTVTAERRMNLGDLITARRRWPQRPAWSALFAKAFAQVAAERPALRRSYLNFPWPHLHQHPEPVAAIAVERDYDGEEAVFFARARRPHQWPLSQLDARLRRFQSEPIAKISQFRRTLRAAALPWPFRRLWLWLGLYGSGRWRERCIGTFAVSSTAAAGAGMLHLISGLTTTLHYGLFDADGRLEMRLTFDHRVLDGATAARALVAMEEVLRGSILRELAQPAIRNVA